VNELTAIDPRRQPEPALAEPETVRLRATSGFSRVLSPRELWRYRDLAFQIAARDVTVRYRQTALGAAWAILQPVGFMIVFTLFFGRVAGIASDGIPYALFSLSGLVAWTYFANGVLLGAESLVTNSALVSKIYFPRIFMPAGVLAAGFVDLGITAGLSALNVRYRDVRYVIPFLIQIWLFATPIAYPSSLIEEPWRTLTAINPMVGVVEGFRWATLGTGDAPLELIGISAAASLLLLAAGLVYFDRVERSFADHI
jgi:lipopolysaccharide transport system permease protein